MSKKRSKPTKMERRETIKTSLFIVPSFIGVLLFYIIPFGIVIYYSMIENPISREFVGLENYKRIFTNAAFLASMKHTAIFSLISVPLAIIIPLLFAIILTKNLPMQSTFRTILISPLMVPVASIILIWNIIFHLNGALNDWLANWNILPIDWLVSDYNKYVMVLLFIWKNAGYNMILFLSALANIPGDLIDSAKLDGAGAFKIFRRVKMPYITSSIFFVGILSLINSFKVFREIYLLAGDHPYGELYMLQHFMNNTFRSLDYQKLSSAAVVMSVIFVVIIGMLFVVDDRLSSRIEE